MRKSFFTGLVCLTLSFPGWADKLYVRNKPFTGYLQGTAQNWRNSEADLGDLCAALGLNLHEAQGNWVVLRSGENDPSGLRPGARELWVAGRPFHYRMESGHRLVRLGDFADALGATLKRNPEAESIDLNLVAAPVKPVAAGPDMSTHRLLYFGADWAPASKLFKPVVEEFESRAIMPVTYIDCTQPRSANYKNNINYFQGNRLPYTVLVSPRGKVVQTWTGYQEIGAFITEIQKLIKK